VVVPEPVAGCSGVRLTEIAGGANGAIGSRRFAAGVRTSWTGCGADGAMREEELLPGTTVTGILSGTDTSPGFGCDGAGVLTDGVAASADDEGAGVSA